MDVAPPFSTGVSSPSPDPRLEPTPDYGTLGPGSDIKGLAPGQGPVPKRRSASPLASVFAALVGIVAALVAGMLSNKHAIWPKPTSSHPRPVASAHDFEQFDRMKPQKQAEALLELAVGHSQGAVDQISSRVDRWKGKVEWNPQIASLTTAALNSNDMRVRESGVEVELAAYGLAKNSASLEYLLNAVNSPDYRQKIWGLWALGLIANRGVETGPIADVLTSHLQDGDVDSRRWAAEALALTGADEAIHPLLASLHDDPSPLVRERAACGLAQSGMFTPEQRMTAVPQLLNYSEDAALDIHTRAWVFQALSDISQQRLSNDPLAWRRWYDSQK